MRNIERDNILNQQSTVRQVTVAFCGFVILKLMVQAIHDQLSQECFIQECAPARLTSSLPFLFAIIGAINCSNFFNDHTADNPQLPLLLRAYVCTILAHACYAYQDEITTGFTQFFMLVGEAAKSLKLGHDANLRPEL